MPYARVLIVEGAVGDPSITLRDEPVLVGRAPQAGIRFEEGAGASVSARHALLIPASGRWVVRDLDSTNGTYVNGTRIESDTGLSDGDRVRFGAAGPELIFNPSERAAAAFRPGTRRVARRFDGVPASRYWPLGAAVLLILGVGSWAVTRGGGVQPDRALAPPPSSYTASPTDSSTRDGGEARVSPSDPGRELRASQRRVDSLEALLATVQAGRTAAAPRSGEDLDSIRRQLQTATSALRRAQMAPSLDSDRLALAIGPAVGQVFADFGDRVLAGTGLVIDSEGRMVTCRHLVQVDGRRAERVAVQMSGSASSLSAVVLRVSQDSDLALLQIDNGPAGPFHARFNDSVDTLRAGAPLVAFGFPLGGAAGRDGGGVASTLLTTGILIDQTAERIRVEGYGAEGASGSPVVDRAGGVVGIIQGGQGTGADRVLHAVPADMVLRFLGRRPEG